MEPSPIDRAMIAMQLEELLHRDIAHVVGLSEGAVGVRLHRIRNKPCRVVAGEEVDHAGA